MPIYEYRCESCSDTFEVLTSFAERDRGQACPSCSSARTRVQVSSFAFAGGASEALDFGEPKASGGGCCGGGCGSCGCGSASTLN
jgi:putative FmdB family regulatory protein